MDDSKAKEALFTLGAPHLEWEQTESGDYDEWMSQEVMTGTTYVITEAPPVSDAGQAQQGFEARVLGDERETLHATLELAKAACERHYATGEWQ